MGQYSKCRYSGASVDGIKRAPQPLRLSADLSVPAIAEYAMDHQLELYLPPDSGQETRSAAAKPALPTRLALPTSPS